MRATAKRFSYLILLVGSTIIGVELVLRVFSLAPTEGTFTVTQAEFDRIPGLFSPYQSLVERVIPPLAHDVAIDSLGYRGDHFPRRRPPGELRIVLAGDSFTWGSYVDDDQTLPAHLEETLVDVCGSVTVINAGIPSTTIVGHGEMIRRSIPLDPTVAVVVFQDSDLGDLVNGPMWMLIEQNRIAKSKFPLSIAYPILRRTALWNLGLEVRRKMLYRSRDGQKDGSTGLKPGGQDTQADSLYLSYLRELRDTVSHAGLPLVLAAYPAIDGPLPPPESPRAGRIAVQAARRLGIPAFDLLMAFSQSGLSPEELTLLPHDGHPSPLGHRVAAEALAAALMSLPFVQVACNKSDPTL